MTGSGTALVAAKVASQAGAISPFGPLNTALISIMITLLVFLLKYQLANRKMTIQVNGEVRQEFISEMHALREQVTGLRDDNEGLRVEIRTLRRENDQLRDEVRSLHGVIDGMRRDNLQTGLSAQRVVAETMPQSPAMDRALRSLGSIQGSNEA